jgi:hypothetical protein
MPGVKVDTVKLRRLVGASRNADRRAERIIRPRAFNSLPDGIHG